MLVPSLWKKSWLMLDDYVTEMGPSSFTIRMQVQSWKRVLDDCRTSTLWLFRTLRNRETWFQNGRACQVSQSKLPKLGRKARHSCKTGRLGSGFEQHRSKWSEIGNGSILHKWNQVGWLLYITMLYYSVLILIKTKMRFMCLMSLKSILWCGFALAWVGNPHESVTSVSVDHLEGTQRSPNWPNN